MATSYPTLALTSSFQDVLALPAYSGAASAAGVTWQNRGQVEITLYAAASAPAGALDGLILKPGQAFYDKTGSAKMWAKGPGSVAVVKD